MEAIGGLIGIVVFFWLIGFIWQAGLRSVSAVARTAAGKGSLADTFNVAFRGLGTFEARLRDDNSDGIPAKEIQVEGQCPIEGEGRLGIVTSIVDKTSGELGPVISRLDFLQEPHTLVYQHTMNVGLVNQGSGFSGWVRAGVILPQVLEPPYGGS